MFPDHLAVPGLARLIILTGDRFVGYKAGQGAQMAFLASLSEKAFRVCPLNG